MRRHCVSWVWYSSHHTTSTNYRLQFTKFKLSQTRWSRQTRYWIWLPPPLLIKSGEILTSLEFQDSIIARSWTTRIELFSCRWCAAIATRMYSSSWSGLSAISRVSHALASARSRCRMTLIRVFQAQLSAISGPSDARIVVHLTIKYKTRIYTGILQCGRYQGSLVCGVSNTVAGCVPVPDGENAELAVHDTLCIHEKIPWDMIGDILEVRIHRTCMTDCNWQFVAFHRDAEVKIYSHSDRICPVESVFRLTFFSVHEELGVGIPNHLTSQQESH